MLLEPFTALALSFAASSAQPTAHPYTLELHCETQTMFHAVGTIRWVAGMRGNQIIESKMMDSGDNNPFFTDLFVPSYNQTITLRGNGSRTEGSLPDSPCKIAVRHSSRNHLLLEYFVSTEKYSFFWSGVCQRDDKQCDMQKSVSAPGNYALGYADCEMVQGLPENGLPPK